MENPFLKEFENKDFFLDNHKIKTDDGWILTLQRVLKINEISKCSSEAANISKQVQPSSSKVVKKPVVLLVHGFIASGATWFVNYPDKVLPYFLYNEGYDCWIANCRGTDLSSHEQFNKKSSKFWDFSVHEIGLYDIKSMIDYIVETTTNDNLAYIGHSLGCTLLYLLLQEKPEYCAKVNCQIALAPAVYGSSMRNWMFKPFIYLGNVMGKLRHFRNKPVITRPFLDPYSKLSKKSPYQKVAVWLTQTFARSMGSFSGKQIEEERWLAIAATFPSPSSRKVFCHGAQCWRTDSLKQYDYGRPTNLKLYGSETPPEYDFKKVNIPVFTFFADDDELCRPEDVKKLKQILPNLVEEIGITQPGFSHLDFVIGKDAPELVFSRILDILGQYHSHSN